MGGSIYVATTAGEGSEFTFQVEYEISAEESKKAEEVQDKDTEMDFAGKRLLLVDDMLINREIARTVLEMNGFQVEEADNGERAVEMVENSTPGYYNAVLMANHGVIVGDKTIHDAFLKLTLAESYAQVVLNTKILGGAKILNNEQVNEILKLRKKL